MAVHVPVVQAILELLLTEPPLTAPPPVPAGRVTDSVYWLAALTVKALEMLPPAVLTVTVPAPVAAKFLFSHVLFAACQAMRSASWRK